MAKTTPTYEEAITRLEAIVKSFEDGSLEVEQLSAKLQEAQKLLKICRTILRKAETDVTKLLDNE